MNMKKAYSALSNSAAFKGIADNDIEQLINDLHAYERGYSKNYVIYHVGDTLDFFPVLLRGEVKAELLQGERRQLVQVFKAGESFAEAVPVSLGVCPVEVTAQTAVTILCIPAEELQDNLDINARRLHANLMTEMSKKITNLSSKLSLLSEPKLSDRLLAYFRTLPLEADGSVHVPMKYTELADYLGVNKASLSRAMHVMEDEGAIEMNGRVVRIIEESE